MPEHNPQLCNKFEYSNAVDEICTIFLDMALTFVNSDEEH